MQSDVQGAATALAAMHRVVQAKDAEIAELKERLETAVQAEKARWASTFNALVTSVREPFHTLQHVSSVAVQLVQHRA